MIRKRIRAAALVLAALFCCTLCGCGAKKAGAEEVQLQTKDGTPVADVDVLQFRRPVQDALVAVLDTDRGEVSVLLFPEAAPQAVQNFVTLARQGAYDGLDFLQVAKDYLVQTGDTDGYGGESIWGSAFPAEVSDLLHHYTGALAMAGGAENNSQFYVVNSTADSVTEELLTQMREAGWSEDVIAAYTQVGGAPWLDNNYTVFGQVFYGMDAVRKIGGTAPESGTRPEEPAKLLQVSVTTFGAWCEAHPDAVPVFAAPQQKGGQEASDVPEGSAD